MRTLYMELCRKRDLLEQAEKNAIEREKLSAAWLWKKQRLDLEAIIGAIPVEEAGQEYNEEVQAEHIAGVLVRVGAAIPIVDLV